MVSIYDSSVRTGNETLDVLLANKSLQCEQRGIRFDRMIDGELLDFMKPADIYSLFGNAVDNAIEAVLRLDDDADRYVSMTVCKRKEMLSIHMSANCVLTMACRRPRSRTRITTASARGPCV